MIKGEEGRCEKVNVRLSPTALMNSHSFTFQYYLNMICEDFVTN